MFPDVHVAGHRLMKSSWKISFLVFVTVFLLFLFGLWNFSSNSSTWLFGYTTLPGLHQSFFGSDEITENHHDGSVSFPPDLPKMPLPSWIVQYAGPISPFHRTSSYEPPPKECKLVQVNQLQRHGARYPTPKVNRRIKTALRKLMNSTHLHQSLKFLTNYHYRLGRSSLTPLGAAGSVRAGSQFALRYGKLIHPKALPFIRASLSERVVDSAKNFSLGLLSQLGHTEIGLINPLLMSEDPQFNNTLDNNSCPNRKPSVEKHRWLKIFARPITQRLNSLAINANLNDQNTLSLMQLCIFESLSLGKISEFCKIFHKSDWPGFGYYFDLDKYYGHGVGNNLGGIEGLGYVSEILSRLTGDKKWVNEDRSKVNHTLDESDSTFPLDRNCYIDFSHDNQMISILAALGIQTKEDLPETGPKSSKKNWDVSKWMPFGSRLTIEKFVCNDNQNEFIRFLLNDMLMEIPLIPMENNQFSSTSTFQNNYFMYSINQFVHYHENSLKNSGKLFRKCFSIRNEVDVGVGYVGSILT